MRIIIQNISARGLFDIFNADYPGWVDFGGPPELDYKPESSFMGGDYVAEDLDHVYLAWHKTELVAIATYLNDALPQEERFRRLISTLIPGVKEEQDLRLLHFKFEFWRISELANGNVIYEIFDGTYYLDWCYSAAGSMLGFDLENWLVLAANCRPSSDGSSFSDLVRDEILPWRANRFPDTERNPQSKNRVLSFTEGSYANTTVEVILESMTPSSNPTLPPLNPPPTA
jgi:hypothetical protein